MKKTNKELDQKIFDAFVDLAHVMIEKGYAKAWFNWIEWIGLTTLIFIAAKKIDSSFLYTVAIFSAFILFFVGLAGVEKLRDDFVPSFPGGKLVSIIVSFFLSIIGLWLVENVLLKLLHANIS